MNFIGMSGLGDQLVQMVYQLVVFVVCDIFVIQLFEVVVYFYYFMDQCLVGDFGWVGG